ncbi:MAG TPA: VWA domain-containing protein [Pyrinomonadaceae bacterium]|nr:VWA domain-containing protein [Pyrinomonadaceae bacterium]
MVLHVFFRCLAALFCATLMTSAAFAQAKPEKPVEQDDVIRVNTELVQTDVMVFDKQGRFVDGLKAEQFELKVDKKPQTISFFERVTSARDNTRPAANQITPSESSSAPSTIRTAGRVVIFFIDDLHLSAESIARTRKSLLEFISGGIAKNDIVAITSSSGQIGFLQQFTDDKLVLQSAVARLSYRASAKPDMDQPPMSEYIAAKIRDGDESTISFYVQEMLKQNCFKVRGETICMMDAHAARNLAVQRANMITIQSAPDTDNTLRMLEGLMRTAAQLPGRKLLFMISDGFYLADKKTGSPDKIRRITDAAGKAGVVIYTLDARGLINEGIDVTNNRPTDSGGLTHSSIIGEIAASQDGLNALARDTGGRAFRNTNAPMSEWVDKVLDETANYYLLAWRPDTEEQQRGKFNHLEANIIGRPDLTVRVRSAYFKTAPLPVLSLKKKEKDPEKAREDDMRAVIDTPLSQTQLPTELEVVVNQMPGVGTRAAVAIRINRDYLAFDLNDGKQSADLDIGGIFYDDKGKPLNSFVGRLRVFPLPENSDQKKPIYAFNAWLPPGLYQVRVGVRDLKSGRAGSAMQWVQIPKLPSR